MADFAEKNAKQLIALMGAMAMNGTGRPLGADRRRGLGFDNAILRWRNWAEFGAVVARTLACIASLTNCQEPFRAWGWLKAKERDCDFSGWQVSEKAGKDGCRHVDMLTSI